MSNDLLKGTRAGNGPAERRARLQNMLCGLTVLLVLTVLSAAGCGGTVTTDPASPSAQGPAGTGGTGTDPGTGTGAGNGVASLSWVAPTTTVSGDPIATLSGYNIYYGTSTGRYTTKVNAGSGTSYLVTALTEGTTYYFAVTAYDANGFESDHSTEVSKYVN